MTRFETLKEYLAEAQKDEENNKLYIEDLLVSIEHEKHSQPKPRADIIMNASLD